MNRRLAGKKGLSSLPALSECVAFNKGVEWFVELAFFYGVLFGLAFYEINKAEQAKTKQNTQIRELQEQTSKQLDQIKDLVSSIKACNEQRAQIDGKIATLQF